MSEGGRATPRSTRAVIVANSKSSTRTAHFRKTTAGKFDINIDVLRFRNDLIHQ